MENNVLWIASYNMLIGVSVSVDLHCARLHVPYIYVMSQ